LANDQWDLDWAFERQILHLPVNGRMQKLVLTAGKEAVYDAVDSETGRYLFSFDLGLQNLITSIDLKTGAKSVDPKLIPGDGRTVTVCPHAAGAKSWLPAAYDPPGRVLYVPLVESCKDLIPTRKGHGLLSSDVQWTLRPRPNSDGRYGRLQAVQLETRKTLWTIRQRAPQTTGVLATAGGILFAGALDRWFTAYRADTGMTLWRIRLSDAPYAAPITYLANGKQYVAVVVGSGYGQTETFLPLVPEIQPPATRNSAIWAFELP
jgi:alcohol dehydrogenase (cytochrome c)